MTEPRARFARAQRVHMIGPLTRLHGSGVPAVHPFLVTGRIGRFAQNADVTDDHLHGLVLWLAVGGAASLITGALVSIVHAAAMGMVLIVVPLIVARRWAGRRTGRLVAQLPDAVDLVSRSLRSGASLAQALRDAKADGPPEVQAEFATIVAGLERGQSVEQALRTWVQRMPLPQVRIVAASLAVASQNEAGTTRALEGVSHSLRDRAGLRAEIRSQSAQAAASMQALVAVPLLFLGLDAIGSQQTLRFLTREPMGQLCLAFGLALNTAGWVWMSSCIRRRLPG